MAAAAYAEQQLDTKQGRRKAYQKRYLALRNERIGNGWDPHYSELSRKILPRNGRFVAEDRNRGERRYNEIFDETAGQALDVLIAGLMSGASSPARPWFRLETSDPELNRDPQVREWLDDCTTRMLEVFKRSNTYRVLKHLYKELAVFGTAACILVEDFDNVIHLHPMTVGQYVLAQDYKERVNTFGREFQITVAQCVEEFGLEACSKTVQEAHKRGDLDQPVNVTHLIEPRQDRDPSKPDARNKAWRSCYFESASSDAEDKLLRESGFDKFPVLAPRWDVAGGDVYGESPAMKALGSIKQLQHEQVRKAQGIDRKANPSMQLPTDVEETALLPGEQVRVDSGSPGAEIRPTHEAQYLDLSDLREDILDVQERINAAFFRDVFRMVTDKTKEMTVPEYLGLHEEKLTILGPILEHLDEELFAKLIDLTFDRMMAVKAFLPTPPELAQFGAELSIQFVGPLAQAQRAAGMASSDRFSNALIVMAEHKPEVLDRLDADAWVDDFAERTGVSPKILVPVDEAQQIRQARAKAQAAAAQTQMLAEQAKAAQALGTVDTQQPNLATDVLSQFQGYDRGQQAVVGGG